MQCRKGSAGVCHQPSMGCQGLQSTDKQKAVLCRWNAGRCLKHCLLRQAAGEQHIYHCGHNPAESSKVWLSGHVRDLGVMSSLFQHSHGREKLCTERAQSTLCLAKQSGGARASMSQPAGQQLLCLLWSKRLLSGEGLVARCSVAAGVEDDAY